MLLVRRKLLERILMRSDILSKICVVVHCTVRLQLILESPHFELEDGEFMSACFNRPASMWGDDTEYS